jgi:hypothetical protein
MKKFDVETIILDSENYKLRGKYRFCFCGREKKIGEEISKLSIICENSISTYNFHKNCLLKELKYLIKKLK